MGSDPLLQEHGKPEIEKKPHNPNIHSSDRGVHLTDTIMRALQPQK